MLLELPTGARLATMTCYNCWKERKFPTAEFMSFLQSIAAHSPLLARLFENHRIGDGAFSFAFAFWDSSFRKAALLQPHVHTCM